MMLLIPDVAYEIEGDIVRLEQSAGCGEAVMIELHRIHLQHLAMEMRAGIGPDKRDVAIATLCRQMRLLRERIEELRHLIECIPCFPPGSGPCEEETAVAALDDLAAIFCEELPDVAPRPSRGEGNSGPRSLDRAEGVDGHQRAPDNPATGRAEAAAEL